MSGLVADGVKRRYRDAYILANVVAGVGDGIKVLGIVAAVVICLAGVLAANTLGSIALVACGISGVFTGAMIYIFGVLIAAQGQMQRAMLDVAVNTSPTLNVNDKQELIVGLTTQSMVAGGSSNERGAAVGVKCPDCEYVFGGTFGKEGWWCPNCSKARH